MKNSINYLFSLAAFLLLFTACGKQGAQETENADTDMAKIVSPEVVFENTYSEVVKVSLAPGEALAAHEGAERVIYSLSDYTIDWVEKGRDEGAKSWSEGDVHAHEAGEHSAQNNGNTTAEWLAFVKKEASLPDCADNTLDKDVNSVAADYAEQLFENAYFRVTEVSLPAGASIPMHSGINRIIYSLSDYQILYESDKEGTVEKSFKSGEVHWHDACQHALENTGETTARFLVVSYKE
jgi:quercetin dioxygenase-like cupin family protein